MRGSAPHYVVPQSFDRGRTLHPRWFRTLVLWGGGTILLPISSFLLPVPMPLLLCRYLCIDIHSALCRGRRQLRRVQYRLHCISIGGQEYRPRGGVALRRALCRCCVHGGSQCTSPFTVDGKLVSFPVPWFPFIWVHFVYDKMAMLGGLVGKGGT